LVTGVIAMVSALLVLRIRIRVADPSRADAATSVQRA